MPASSDPDLTVRAVKETVELYARAADQILLTVARRLRRGITQPGWAEQKLSRWRSCAPKPGGAGPAAGRQPEAVEQGLTEAYEHGVRDAAADVGDLQPPVPRLTNERAVQALVQEATTALRGTRLRILRSTTDVTGPRCSRPHHQRHHGVRTRRQAAQQVLDRFAQQRVTGFVERTGRLGRWSRTPRWGCARAPAARS